MGNFKNTYSKLSTAPVKKYMSLTDGYKNLIVNKLNKFEFIPESFTISTTPIQSQVHTLYILLVSSTMYLCMWHLNQHCRLNKKGIYCASTSR